METQYLIPSGLFRRVMTYALRQTGASRTTAKNVMLKRWPMMADGVIEELAMRGLLLRASDLTDFIIKHSGQTRDNTGRPIHANSIRWTQRLSDALAEDSIREGRGSWILAFPAGRFQKMNLQQRLATLRSSDLLVRVLVAHLLLQSFDAGLSLVSLPALIVQKVQSLIRLAIEGEQWAVDELEFMLTDVRPD